MRIVDLMWSLEEYFSHELIHSRVKLLESKTEAGFQNAIEIIDSMHRFSEDTEKLLKKGSQCPDAMAILEEVVATHNVLLGRLIQTRISQWEAVKSGGA